MNGHSWMRLEGDVAIVNIQSNDVVALVTVECHETPGGQAIEVRGNLGPAVPISAAIKPGQSFTCVCKELGIAGGPKSKGVYFVEPLSNLKEFTVR